MVGMTFHIQDLPDCHLWAPVNIVSLVVELWQVYLFNYLCGSTCEKQQRPYSPQTSSHQ